MKTTCTLNDITYTDQNIYVAESLCEGENDSITQTSSVTTTTSMNYDSKISVSLNSGKTEDGEINIKDYKNIKMINIVVDKLEKGKGWTEDGYYFIITTKEPINNNVGISTLSLNIINEENDKISAETKCIIPTISNKFISSFDCIAKDLSSSGSFKILDKVIYDSTNTFPKISLISPQNKKLNIEKKTKLSNGAKIGIILGVCVTVGICIALIVMYKTGVFGKSGGSSNNVGYTIAPDRSRNIAPGEIKDTTSNEFAIKAMNDKFRK